MSNKFVVTQILDNVSTLTEAYRVSPIVEHHNVPWATYVQRVDDTLHCFLNCRKARQGNGNWSIKTKISLRIVSLKQRTLAKSIEHTFGSESEFISTGIGPYIGFEELKRDYVVDDKLILEAHVTIEEITGIERPANLRNFDGSEPYDLILKVEDKRFHVLKHYLTLQSPVFKSLLEGSFKESKEDEVTLKDVIPEDFQNFLELLYNDPTLTDSNIDGILQLTDMYDTKNQIRNCELWLIVESKHSLRTKIRLAAKYKLNRLKNHCFENMKTLADVNSVLGPDLYQLDPSIATQIIQKTLSFFP